MTTKRAPEADRTAQGMAKAAGRGVHARRDSAAAGSMSGVKALVAAASLAATLGGWAYLARPEPPVVEVAQAADYAPAAPTIALQLPEVASYPMPTLVPPRSATNSDGSTPMVLHPTPPAAAAPLRIAEAPLASVAKPAPAQPLRRVQPPVVRAARPAPAAVTRSSR